LTDVSDSATSPQIDVKQTATYRAMLAVVITLGVLIVAALAALVAGIFLQIGHGAPQATASTLSYEPPPGARLIAMETSGDRLILRLRNGGSEEVDIVNTDDGKLVARFRFAAQGP
jgi:hypothetical protein